MKERIVENVDKGLEVPTHFTIHEWYVPNGKTRPGTGCAVRGCNGEAAYHLCMHHAIPGMVVGEGTSMFVISIWLVQRRNALHFIVLNDYALGDLFDGRAGFESQLASQGYQVLKLISSEEELEATHLRHPAARLTPWSEDEDGSPAIGDLVRERLEMRKRR